jgi:hypothetical protein
MNEIKIKDEYGQIFTYMGCVHTGINTMIISYDEEGYIHLHRPNLVKVCNEVLG